MNDAYPVELQDGGPGEVGLVRWQDYALKEPFTFDCGRVFPSLNIRYETYGRLNAQADNAILICHALSGDHHCAGVHSIRDAKPGWWNNLIGPGKPVDTSRYFVVCANCVGGCQGSTGPGSIDPDSGRRYGTNFPQLTIRDMVRAQKILLEKALGITTLYAVIGGSMGGMQALQWMIDYPDSVRRVIALATTGRQSAQAIAFNEVGRCAIMQDPGWHGGDYEQGKGPNVGLSVARMMAHITYLSDTGLEEKFGRSRASGPETRPSARSSRSSSTCTIRARASSTASTRTHTCTSPRRSTASTSTGRAAAWRTASRT
jgi:homoserine O-acetyltransferase